MAATARRTKRGRPRLINVAIILSAAALIMHVLASHLPPPNGGPGTISEIAWLYVHSLAYILFLVAIGAWVLWAAVRIIRWAADFQGF